MNVPMKWWVSRVATGIMGLVLATSGFCWDITFDGDPLTASKRAWVADSGQVMVALDDLVPEWIDAYAFDFDGWQITIVAGSYGITAMVANPEMKRNGFAATFEEAPVVKDKILWFPIEALASLMNYAVEKDAGSEKLMLRTRKNEADAVEAADILGPRMASVANNSVFPRTDIAHFEDLLIPGSQGFLSVRLYDPNPGDSTVRGVYLNIHGGGWRVGSIASSDHVCRDIANQSGHKVLSIEYSMLPEHPFPVGWEDVYSAAVWVYEHHRQLGIDPNRIIVGGDSAGGNIANAVAMMARDRGSFPVAGIVLAYPVLDMAEQSARPLFVDPADAQSPYVTAKNGSLAGLPPTLILVAENDFLRPQGEAYAELLAKAGAPVDFDVVEGTKHGFLATHLDSRARIGRFIQSVAE